MKIWFLFLLLGTVILFSCDKNNSQGKILDKAAAEKISEPKDTSKPNRVMSEVESSEASGVDTVILAEVMGDILGDTIPEKVIVSNTGRQSEFGTIREMQIYEKEEGKWKLVHSSTGAILPSEHGGMIGDPFEEIKIERKCIVITHFGGSGWTWRYTHRYRFQKEDWYLIGVTTSYGTPCEYWKNTDFNLVTGKVNWVKTVESCLDGEPTGDPDKTENSTFIHKILLPKMDGFDPGNTEVSIPEKENESFYY